MKTIIRTAASAAVAMTLAVASVPAQAQAQHSLVEGAWALQFRIAQDLTLGTFSGGIISAKHHRSADRALRYGVSFGTQHISLENDDNQTATQIGLVAELLTYPTVSRDPGGNIHLFWGGGPAIHYQRFTVRPEGADPVTDQMLLVGAVGSIGAEWFVRPRIGLTAEYQSSANVGFGTERLLLQLGQQGVRFGASVYFGP